MIHFKFQEQKDVPVDLDWLHPSELEIYNSFRFEKRKQDWLLGRWTAKNLLIENYYTDLDPDKIAILAGENRAPYVYLNGEKNHHLISISHSHALSFCVSTNQEIQVGCDLEKIEKRSDFFLQDYFSDLERRKVNSIGKVLSEEMLYTTFWSAKEALMKATRQGMSLHPKKIEISNIEFDGSPWKSLEIKNLETEESYYGKFGMKGDMVFVLVSDQDKVLIG